MNAHHTLDPSPIMFHPCREEAEQILASTQKKVSDTLTALEEEQNDVIISTLWSCAGHVTDCVLCVQAL